MSASLTYTEAQLFTALRGFLIGILAPGTPVIRSYANRVPEPGAADFVLMSQVLRHRLSTNIETDIDCVFVGAISGNALAVTQMQMGSIVLGAPVYGPTVAAGTQVTAFGTGTGGIGTYTVSIAQTVLSQPLAAGIKLIVQPTEFTIQIDVHGPAAGDNAQIISTLFRDQTATEFFDSLAQPVDALYADEPRFTPFLNAEQQIEYRWVIDAHLQMDAPVQLGQQFFASIALTSIQADGVTLAQLWGTNVPGFVVGTNVADQAVVTGLTRSPVSGVIVQS